MDINKENSGFLCLIHYKSLNNNKEKAVQLTSNRLSTVKTVSEQWKTLNLSNSKEEKIVKKIDEYFNTRNEDTAPIACYHPSCYRRFIDKKRRHQTLKRKPLTDITAHCVTSPKNLRSSNEIAQFKTRNSAVLPPVCIICKKQTKYITKHCKRIKDALSQAETEDGGWSYRYCT